MTSCCVNVNSIPSFRYRFVSNRWKTIALMVACPVLSISPKSLKVFQTHLLYLQLLTAVCGAQADVETTSVPSAGALPISAASGS